MAPTPPHLSSRRTPAHNTVPTTSATSESTTMNSTNNAAINGTTTNGSPPTPTTSDTPTRRHTPPSSPSRAALHSAASARGARSAAGAKDLDAAYRTERTEGNATFDNDVDDTDGISAINSTIIPPASGQMVGVPPTALDISRRNFLQKHFYKITYSLFTALCLACTVIALLLLNLAVRRSDNLSDALSDTCRNYAFLISSRSQTALAQLGGLRNYPEPTTHQTEIPFDGIFKKVANSTGIVIELSFASLVLNVSRADWETSHAPITQLADTDTSSSSSQMFYPGMTSFNAVTRDYATTYYPITLTISNQTMYEGFDILSDSYVQKLVSNSVTTGLTTLGSPFQLSIDGEMRNATLFTVPYFNGTIGATNMTGVYYGAMAYNYMLYKSYSDVIVNSSVSDNLNVLILDQNSVVFQYPPNGVFKSVDSATAYDTPIQNRKWKVYCWRKHKKTAMTAYAIIVACCLILMTTAYLMFFSKNVLQPIIYAYLAKTYKTPGDKGRLHNFIAETMRYSGSTRSMAPTESIPIVRDHISKVLNEVKEPLCIFNREGYVLFSNEAACKATKFQEVSPVSLRMDFILPRLFASTHSAQQQQQQQQTQSSQTQSGQSQNSSHLQVHFPDSPSMTKSATDPHSVIFIHDGNSELKDVTLSKSVSTSGTVGKSFKSDEDLTGSRTTLVDTPRASQDKLIDGIAFKRDKGSVTLKPLGKEKSSSRPISAAQSGLSRPTSAANTPPRHTSTSAVHSNNDGLNSGNKLYFPSGTHETVMQTRTGQLIPVSVKISGPIRYTVDKPYIDIDSHSQETSITIQTAMFTPLASKSDGFVCSMTNLQQTCISAILSILDEYASQGRAVHQILTDSCVRLIQKVGNSAEITPELKAILGANILNGDGAAIASAAADNHSAVLDRLIDSLRKILQASLANPAFSDGNAALAVQRMGLGKTADEAVVFDIRAIIKYAHNNVGRLAASKRISVRYDIIGMPLQLASGILPASAMRFGYSIQTYRASNSVMTWFTPIIKGRKKYYEFVIETLLALGFLESSPNSSVNAVVELFKIREVRTDSIVGSSPIKDSQTDGQTQERQKSKRDKDENDQEHNEDKMMTAFEVNLAMKITFDGFTNASKARLVSILNYLNNTTVPSNPDSVQSGDNTSSTQSRKYDGSPHSYRGTTHVNGNPTSNLNGNHHSTTTTTTTATTTTTSTSNTTTTPQQQNNTSVATNINGNNPQNTNIDTGLAVLRLLDLRTRPDLAAAVVLSKCYLERLGSNLEYFIKGRDVVLSFPAWFAIDSDVHRTFDTLSKR